MSKHALPILTGGLNEVTRSDLIDNSQLQKCNNYEVVGDGVLRKRKGVSEYEGDEDGTLKLAIDYVFDSIIYISEPYYPQNKLVDGILGLYTLQTGPIEMSGDFILFVFGITSSGDYQLHSFIKWPNLDTGENYWSHFISHLPEDTYFLSEILTDAGIVYTSESDIEIFIGTNRVNIVDGVNRGHFVAIDPDGIMNAGVSGIPAPTNKARVERLTSWETGMWESDPSASRLSEPGLFQCTYTVVSKTGEESNPSPLSETVNLQYFKKDVDGIEEQWIDKITVKDLSVPDVAQNILDNLKYFKIYMRVIKYSEGFGVESLELTEQFEIINKKNDAGDILESGPTGNDYILKVEVEPGNLASYENDVAPIAKTGAEIGGITMLGNVKTKLKFPWDFQYFHNIRIANKDSKSYVDAVIKIRLWDKDATPSSGGKAIENFTVSDWGINDVELGISGLKRHNSSQIRLFDQDSTTPLKVLFNGRKNPEDLKDDGTESGNYIDLYVEIPYLTAQSDHTIYLCWTPGAVGDEDGLAAKIAETGYAGVPDVYNVDPETSYSEPPLYWEEEAGFKYGMFFQNRDHNNLMQSVFKARGVLSSDNLLYDDFSGVNPSSDFAHNRYDGSIGTSNNYGAAEFADNTVELDQKHKHPIIDEIIENRILKLTNEGGIDYDYDGSSRTLHIMPDNSGGHKQTLMCRMSASLPGSVSFRPIITLYQNDDYHLTYMIGSNALDTSGTGIPMLYADSGGGSHTIGFETDTEHIGDAEGDAGVFETVTDSNGDIYLKDMIVILSWNYSPPNSEISLHLLYNYSPGVGYSYLSGSSDRAEGTNAAAITLNGGIKGVSIGTNSTVHEGLLDGLELDGPDTLYVSDFRLINNLYLDGSDSSKDIVNQMANYMPSFDNMVGYKYSDTTHNNNITFGETKELLFKDYNNMVKWTDVNYNSYPDLFFKQVREPILKIMPAPSFLQFEYQNTFIIFTRNSINRFVLQGSADGWSGSSSSLIEEKTQYGLLAEKSLVRAGDALFWLSEAGVVMWGKDGMGLISRNIVDVPITDNYIAFYAPLNNQYILTDPDNTDETYVYHIDKNIWSKFKGSEMEGIIKASTLTGGSRLDNINLLLYSDGSLKQYPGKDDSYTDNDATMKTKDMFFESGILRRVKIGYNSDASVDLITNVIKNKADGTETTKTNTISNIENGKWRGISNANSRGKSVSFEVNGADEIESIIYDISIKSGVK